MNQTTKMRELIMTALSHKVVGGIVTTHELTFQCRATEPQERAAVSRAIRQLCEYKVLEHVGGKRSQRYRILATVQGSAEVTHQTVEVDIRAIEARAVAQYLTGETVALEETVVVASQGPAATVATYIRSNLPSARGVFAEFILTLGGLVFRRYDQQRNRNIIPVADVWVRMFDYWEVPDAYRTAVRSHYAPAHYNLLAMVERGLVVQHLTTTEHHGPGVSLTHLGQLWVIQLVLRGVGAEFGASPDGMEMFLEAPELWLQDDRIVELTRQEGKIIRRRYDRANAAAHRHGATD